MNVAVLPLVIAPRDGAPASDFERLFEDHASFEALLDRLIGAFEHGEEDDRRSAYTALRIALLSHMEAEEFLLLPLLHRSSPRSALVVGQEHRHIRSRLKELEGAVGQPSHRGLARSFAAELRAHTRSEEQLLYRWAARHLEAP
jgi:16S rRNA G1207 methylase RsmC